MTECHCCTPDSNGDFEPCCNYTGMCEAYYTESTISNCVHCGGEMFKEGDLWWHHDQKDIPIKDRSRSHWVTDAPASNTNNLNE